MTDSSAADLREGGRIGPYLLDGPIGSGGMGTVWRAWDERLRRHVAVKRVLRDADARSRERLRREARAVARLSHPSIVHIYDLLKGNGADWIIMELVSGENLRQLLDREGRLEVRQVLQLGREIAEGLAEAHGQGILHRDLKAANIMVTTSGCAKILDFGIAKRLQEEGAGTTGSDLSLSTPGAVLGTCFAMSPEQVLGSDLDARSDLFSFGSLLYEVLTGCAPFRAEEVQASLARVLHFRPPPLHEVRPDVPRGLSLLIERLLEKKRHNRPASAAEVCKVLASPATRRSPESPSSTRKGPGALREMVGPATNVTLETVAEEPASRRVRSRSGGALSGRRAQAGERRRLTVVCCGLMGLGETPGEHRFLEIETLSETMAAVQELACQVVEPLGGCYGSALGHVFWLYFGYPRAHEDDMQRAIQAALHLVAEVRQHGPRLSADGQRIALRVAVYAGPAITTSRPGELGEVQLGLTLEVATDLQAAAPPNEIVVSAQSHRMVSRSFAMEGLPSVRLRSAKEPVELYRVVAPLDRREAEGGEVIPLVGRDLEVELLFDRFLLSCSGVGQAVIIQGEAGIGKSRLLRALRERLAEQDATWLVAYGSPYTQSSPLVPVIDLLARLLSGPAEEAPEQKLLRLEEVLHRYRIPVEENAPLLALLLGIPSEHRYSPLTMTPGIRRERTLEILVALLAEMAAHQPLVLVVEDLHWIDPSTLELLGLLLEEIYHISLFLVATCRPEFQASWTCWNRITQIGLSRLSGPQTQELIDHVASERGLSAEVRRQIVDKTDGVPLFIEELTKAVLESGWSGDTLDIPSTLEGSLVARLDRLGEAKEVAQYASVIGRVFSFELLAAISRCERDVLRSSLEELLRAQLLHRRGGASGLTYVFKHALVQDVAYLSLLKRRRQEIHEGIARALEERLQQGQETEPEILAYHFEKAGLIPQAITYLQQAAARMIQRSAFNEALSHCGKGLALLETLPDSQQRWEEELALRSLLRLSLAPIYGYASGEIEANADRCRALCRQLPDTPRLIPVLYGVWANHAMRGNREPTIELAEEIARLAREPVHVFIGCSTRLFVSFYGGRFEEARRLAEQAVALFEPNLRPEFTQGFGDESSLLPHVYQSITQWFCGEPDAAVRKMAQVRVAVEALRSPFLLGMTLLFQILLWRQLRETDRVAEVAKKLLDLANEQQFPFYRSLSQCALGWARCHRGDFARGLNEIRDGLSLHWAIGTRLPRGYWLSFLAEALLLAGRIQEGLAAVEEALTLAKTQLDVYYLAETHRLRGELLLVDGDSEAAETAFREALGIAREQGARALELRAVRSLGELLRQQGRGDEALPLLARVYQAFSEGLATRDLREARQLLEKMGWKL